MHSLPSNPEPFTPRSATGELESSSTPSPLVSVIVVTLNAKDLLKQCLDSLSKQTYPNIEIILVDNGSDENLAAWAETQYPESRGIRLDTNTGFAGGNNVGIRAAKGDYIALLNNDAVAEPAWLTSMVSLATSQPTLGAVASLVIDGNTPTLLDSLGVGIALDGMSRQAMLGAPVPASTESADVLCISGCACLLRRQALNDAGLFDEDFFAYCEDTDLSLRIRRAGYTIATCPTARVLHYYSRTGGQRPLKKIFWIERNHIWVAVKNLPFHHLLLLGPATLWRWCVQAFGCLSGAHSMGSFLENASFMRILLTTLHAHLAAWAGFPRMLARRLAFHPPQRTGAKDLRRLLSRHRLSMYDIVIGRGFRGNATPSKQDT